MFELLRKRRSIRKYSDRPVEKDKIDTLLKSALLAPSSKGIRPWQFIVVDDRETLQKLSQAKPHGASFVANAAAAIVVIADTEKSDVWVEDAAIASVILLMMIEDLDLGGCWCQIRERTYDANATASEYVKWALDIPENFEVESIIGFGYPAETKPGYEENDLKYDTLHLNRFGTRYEV
ncbi:MAG: nitroreductase family protein [Desulfococcaceae bacterium]